MATAELYRRVNGIAVPGHTLEEIQGTSAIPKGLPFRDGHIPAFSLVSVNGTMSEDPAILKNRLIQISPIHCRSFELRFGESGNLYWSDEYGNVFSTLTTKGNNLDNPRIVKNSVSPSGYIVWGLQDSDAMVRVLRASELMRANNIPTEMIIRVIEPLELPFNGKLVSLEELKGLLLTQIWEQNSQQNQLAGSISKDEIPDLSIVLDKMTFYITTRGLQVSERLQDLTEVETKKDFLLIMRRVFGYVNMTERIKAKQDMAYVSTYFDISKDEDIETYLLNYLPKNIATNIARMHRLGLIHRFPHLGNISAAGGLYDLDSVRGGPLGIGDNSITEQDCTSERTLLMEGEKNTNGYGLLKFIDDLKAMTLLNSDSDSRERFVLSFQKAYIVERGWEDDVMGNLEKIYNFFSQFKSPGSRNSLLVHYIDLISNQLGWNFDYPQDIEGMKNLYKQEEETDYRREFERVRDNISTEDYYAYNKKSQQDDDRSILLHRDTSAAFRTLEKDLRERFAVQLQELSTRYDQKMLDMVVSMFVLKYVPRFFKEVDPDNISNEEYCGQDYFRYFKVAIKQEGWEKDVVPHLQQIDQLFENFGFPMGEDYLEYYLALLKEQTGIDFPFYDSDIEPLFDGFIEWSRENFELYLEKAIAEAPSDKDLQTVIKEAYDAGYSQDADFSWDNWTTFVPEKASWIIEERCGSRIEQYLARFDNEDDRDRVRGDIYHILTRRAEKKLIIALTDEMQNEILQRQNQMELEIMAKYTTNPK